jgi:hypothetical protein
LGAVMMPWKRHTMIYLASFGIENLGRGEDYGFTAFHVVEYRGYCWRFFDADAEDAVRNAR